MIREMFRKNCLLFFAAMVICTIAKGQSDVPVKAWSLQECVDYAIRNNMQVKQGHLNTKVEEVTLTQSKANLLPNLNANTSYSHNVGRSVNPFTNIIVDQPVSSHNVSLSSSITLFNGFQKVNTIKRNKVLLDASKYTAEDIQNDVTLQVITAYMNILLNHELLENAEIRLVTTDMQVERTARLVEAGSLPESNLLEIQAQRANDELQIINAKNNIAIATLNLKQLMQLPAQEEMDIVVPEVESPDEGGMIAPLSEIYNTAVALQPDVKAAEARVESAEYDVAIAQGSRSPSISASGFLGTSYSSVADDMLPKEGSSFTEIEMPVGYLASDPTQTVVSTRSIPTEYTENTYWNQLDFNLRRGVSIDMNIPIFNGWQTKSAVSRAKINKEMAAMDVVNTKNVLRQNIEQAYLDVQAAQQRYAATKKQVEALQEAFRVNEQKFNLGVINALDYNLAKTNLNVAESEMIQSKYDYVFKTKILDFYQGKPLSF